MVVAGVLCLFLVRLLHLSSQFPYHFTWDLSLVVAQDCLLIHSGLTPDSIGTTGFGMYFLLVVSQSIAHALGWLSILTLDDLAGSLNPLLTMAELTSYNRLHGVALSFGTALFLWLGLGVLFRPKAVWSVLALFVLVTQESLTYGANQGRIESYSVFYWAAAFLALSFAFRSVGSKWELLWVSLGGLLLGLCFLTKIQSVFYVAALPVYCVFAVGTIPFDKMRRGKGNDVWEEAKVYTTILSVGCIIAFPALLAASYYAVIPEGKSHWAAPEGLTIFGWTGLFMFVGAGLLNMGLIKEPRLGDTRAFAKRMIVFLVLAYSALLLHLFLYANPAIGMSYLLYDAKMILWKSVYGGGRGIADYVRNFKEFVRYHPVLFCGHALALCLVSGFVRKDIRKMWLLGGALGLAVLGYANVGMATRFILRDMVWVETLITVSTLGFLFVALESWGRGKVAVRTVVAVLMVSMAGANAYHNGLVLTRIDGNVNRYAYHFEHWLSNIFSDNQLRYREVMGSRYDNVGESLYIFGQFKKIVPVAAAAGGRQDAYAGHGQAVRHREVRRLVDSIFKNQEVTLKEVGLVWENYPLWTDDLSWRIRSFSETLRGATVVDARAVPSKGRHFFDEKYVSGGGGHYVLDKLEPEGPPNAMSILGRPDYRVLLFVETDQAAAMANSALLLKDERLMIASGGKEVAFRGLEIKNYVNIPRTALPRKYCFVLVERPVAIPDWLH